MSFKFEMLKEQSSIIKVIGVGGGGGNAVNHMYKQGISGVDFIICNTDAQALELSPIPNKVQLGASLTEGMGAGSDPDVGENSAIESIEDIKRMLGSNTKMLFITAGMGGGTGTGASPVLAKAAKELGILTVAIVTTPFAFEGKRRRMQAEDGLNELQKYVDSYLVISNDRLREIFGNLTMSSAFAKADDILTTAAKGIAEIITIPGYVNVDFKDVRTVMNNSGVAIMGNEKAEGEDRALKAVMGALASPLLKDNEIEGARYILLNITSGTKEVTMDEVAVITDYIQEKAGLTADLIWGNCIDETLEEQLSVTIIATGFQTQEERKRERENERIEIALVPENTPLVKPVNQFSPAGSTSPAAPSVAPVADHNKASSSPTLQPDLFGAYIKQQTSVNQLPQDERRSEGSVSSAEPVVRHSLTDPEPVANPEADDMYEVRLSESEFHFSTPEQATGVSIPHPGTGQKVPEPVNEFAEADNGLDDQKVTEQLQKTKERIMKLKALSAKLRSVNGLQELETEPAYRRKQMAFEQVPHSSESQVSRFTLSAEDGITEIRPNNSFLHDNVD